MAAGRQCKPSGCPHPPLKRKIKTEGKEKKEKK
jgi:hypothetical protein